MYVTGTIKGSWKADHVHVPSRTGLSVSALNENRITFNIFPWKFIQRNSNAIACITSIIIIFIFTYCWRFGGTMYQCTLLSDVINGAHNGTYLRMFFSMMVLWMQCQQVEQFINQCVTYPHQVRRNVHSAWPAIKQAYKESVPIGAKCAQGEIETWLEIIRNNLII